MTELEPIEHEPPALVLTDEQRARFLDHVRLNPGVSTRKALAAAGVLIDRPDSGRNQKRQRVPSKAEIEQMLTANPDLRAEYEEARGRDPDKLEAEALRRAVEGVDEPWHVTRAGQVLIRRVYSDRLLMAILKARHPAYRDTSRLEIAGDQGAPVVVRHERGLTLADVLALRERLADADGGPGGGARGQLPAAQPVLPEPADG